MAIDFNSFLNNLRGKSTPVVTPQANPPTTPKPIMASSFMNGLKKVKHDFQIGMLNLKTGASNVADVIKNPNNPFESAAGFAKNIPYVQKNTTSRVENFALNTAKPFMEGIVSAGRGGENIKKGNKIQGAAQILKGTGQVLTPFTTPYQVANFVASGKPKESEMISPQPQNMPQSPDRARRLASGFMRGMGMDSEIASNVKEQKTWDVPLLGKIDPLTTIGSAVGYVKNPVNAKFFKLTEKILPAKLYSTPVVKWLGITATRGGIEGLALGLAEIPENATAQQKVNYLIKTMGEGAVSELLGRGILDSVGKGIELGAKTQVVDDTIKMLKKGADKLKVPVKTMELDKNGERITLPMWQYQLRKASMGLSTQDISKLSPEEYAKLKVDKGLMVEPGAKQKPIQLEQSPKLTGTGKPSTGPDLGTKSVETASLPDSISSPLRDATNPVEKIVAAISGAKPVRKTQEALYTLERQKRLKAVADVSGVPGEAGYYAQLKQLKGEMPKVDFESIRGKIEQPDIDYLFTTVQKSSLSLYEKITAKNGLAKLLGARGGKVPTEGEIKLLSQVFPPDFIDAVLKQRPLMQKFFEGTESVLNVPRAIMASFDLSAPLRQGIFFIGRPKQWVPAFRDMFKYLKSEKALDELMTEIKARPNYELMRESKLALTDTSKYGLSGREEAFMSNLAEKIPVIGGAVRASGRAYTGFLNKLRADVFDDLIQKAEMTGLKQTPKMTEDLAKFINSATGRGDLGKLNKHATLLNTFLFSPRLIASRLNLLNPIYYAKLDPFVRKEALKSLLSFGAIGTTVLGLAKLGGADIETDPTSADFGKIKVGNTRYDPWGGFQQYIRLVAQLYANKITSSTTGVPMTLGEGYKPMTRLDVLSRFIETKEAPVATFVTGLLRGTDQAGKPFKVTDEIASRFTPLITQDLKELSEEEGMLKAGLKLSPGVFGLGVQNYAATPQDIVRSANSIEQYADELFDQGRDEEAYAILDKNQELIDQAGLLGSQVDEIKDLEKEIEATKKDATMSEADKKQIIETNTEQINILTKELNELQIQLKSKTTASNPGPMINPQ